MFKIIKRTSNELLVKWFAPKGVPAMYPIANYPENPKLKVADLVIFADKLAVAIIKISEENTGVLFNLNLNSIPTRFELEAVIFKHLPDYFSSHYSDEISNPLNRILPTKHDTSDFILFKECFTFDLTSQHFSCDINSKSAKINPEFLWNIDIVLGLTTPVATELLETWRTFKPLYWDDQFLLTMPMIEDIITEGIAFNSKNSDTLLSDCECAKHHGEFTNKTREEIPKCKIAAPIITPSIFGTTMYWYFIVANFSDGSTSSPSELGFISNGCTISNTTSATNFLTITWDKVTDAVSYDIYRAVVGDLAAFMANNIGISNVSWIDDGSKFVSTSSVEDHPIKTFGAGTFIINCTTSIDGVASCVKTPLVISVI